MVALVPLPLRVICVAVFIYAFFTFMFISFLTEGGVPAIEHGQYYLNSHGKKIRDITKNEYERFNACEERSSSAYGIMFSLIATIGILIVHPRFEKLIDQDCRVRRVQKQ